MLQNYDRLYSYISEWQTLVYDIYSKHGIAFQVDYYNINKDQTIWDDENIMNGAYESIGDLSGIRWDKYMLLPVYFFDAMTTQFDATENGLTKENRTTIVFPDTYNIRPYPGDLVRPRFCFLNKNHDDSYPIYQVKGAEISANTYRRFWKLSLASYQSRSIDEVDNNQLNKQYVFFEYTKQIHTIEDAQILTQLLVTYKKLVQKINHKFEPNSGFYFV